MVSCLLFLGVQKGWLLVGWLEKYSGSLLSEEEVGRRRSFARRNKTDFCHP